MASLSNINGLFDVHSTGAILFSTSHGANGQILKSNGNSAPTWVDPNTVGTGPWLPLAGGAITGNLTIGGTLGVSGTISQVTASSVIGSFKGTSAPGYAEFNILNDVSHSIVIGSIGSTYSNGDWAGSTYIYNTGSKKMYIKSQNEMRFTTNGHSIANNTALVLDTSYNATFAGSVYAPDFYMNDYIYHNGDTNTYIRAEADKWTFRTGGDDRMFIDNDGVGIRTSVTTGGFNVNNPTAGSYYNMSNADSGSYKYTNPQGRLLTSNGTGWVVDGRDPILTLSSGGNSGATTVGYSIGLNLYSNTSTDDVYSPLIAFSSVSNSGPYATAYAAIGGRKTGAGVDSNWSTGELHFWTAGPSGGGSAAYMQQAPAMLIDDSGNVGINTTSPSTKLSINDANYVEMATFSAASGSTAGIIANNSGYITGFTTSATHQSSNTALFVPVTDGIKITKAGLLQITTAQDFRSTTAANYAQVDIYKNTTAMFYSLRTNTNSQWDMLNSSGTMIVAANDVIKFRYAAGDFLSMDTGAWSQYSFVWTSR